MPAPRKYSISNRNLLIGCLAGGIGLVAALVLLLTAAASGRTAVGLVAEKAQLYLNSTTEMIGKDFAPIHANAERVAEAITSGEYTLEQLDAALPLLTASTPVLDGVGYIRADASYKIYVAPLGRTLSDRLDSNKQTQDLLTGFAENPRTGWIPADRIIAGGAHRFSLLTSLIYDGDFKGVFVQTVTLSAMSRSILSNLRTEDHVPFIISAKDEVLAHPSLSDLDATAPAEKLPTLADTNDPVLINLNKREALKGSAMEAAFVNTEATRLRVNDATYIVLMREVQSSGMDPIRLGVYFDARTELDSLLQFVQSIIVIICIVILVVLAAWWLAIKISIPTQALARAAQAIAEGDLAKVPPVPRSFVTELDSAATSFNRMVADLKESARIRSLFGQVVPKAVAERMIATPGALEPISSPATVLFADLAGFTTICEAMDPPEIIQMLNAYFDEMVQVIEANDGVVTQFQGDAILAVFGVPIEHEDHAVRALTAAQNMLSRVSEQRFAGRELNIRIGINTGFLVAGNVGASERMNYTVHGDAVNLAARLEQMNKQYGSRLLVSEATLDAINMTAPQLEVTGSVHSFAESLHQVGSVEVRGRQRPVIVFAPQM